MQSKILIMISKGLIGLFMTDQSISYQTSKYLHKNAQNIQNIQIKRIFVNLQYTRTLKKLRIAPRKLSAVVFA